MNENVKKSQFKEVYRFYEGDNPIFFYGREEMTKPLKSKIPHQSLFGFNNGTYFKIDRFVGKNEIVYSLPQNTETLNLICYDYLIMKENIETPDITALGYVLKDKKDNYTNYESVDKQYPHTITLFHYFFPSNDGVATKRQTFTISTKRYSTRAYPITELQRVIDRVHELFKTKD